MQNQTLIMNRHQWLLASVILLSSLFQRELEGAEGCSAPSFAAARTFGAGAAVSVAVGDFNGDGKPDLAAANGSNVAVLLGKGDGTFQIAVTYSAGRTPVSVAVGDFNGDSKPDLAVANSGSGGFGGNVSVLLGKGDGIFQAAVNYGAGTQPSSVAVGDFNADGKPDLAVANAGNAINMLTDGSVSVLLGKGDGTFQVAANYVAGPGLFSLLVGDFNGDGKLDLAVAGSALSVLLGKGDGTFLASINAGGAFGLGALGDFNGDGKPDLAVANYGAYDPTSDTYTNSSVSVLLGSGDGTFRVPINSGEAPGSMTSGDFNGDGKVDLAVIHNVSNPGSSANVSVLLEKGDGTFQATVNYGAGTGPSCVAVGDFNGDGNVDLAVGNNNSNTNSVSLVLGKGDGTFQAAVSYGAGWHPDSVAVGDFNGDRKADLAVAADRGVSVLLGNGDGTFKAATNYATGDSPRSVTVGDFNGDGKPDIAVADRGFDIPGGDVAVLLGNGDGTFQAAFNHGAGTNPFSVAAGDFNGDGKADLAIAAVSDVSVLLGNGDGAFMAATNNVAAYSPFSVAVGDFNGDGKPDIAVANYDGGGAQPFGSVSVLLGKGDGTFQAAVDYSAGTSPRSVVVGDFNGDGRADLAVAQSGEISVLLGNGDGGFQRAVAYSAGELCYSVVVGDFNGDSKPDLAAANGFNVAVLLGKGDGTFEIAVNYAAGSGLISAAVGDLNGDGKLDLAVANYYSANVSVLLNTCDSAGTGLAIVRNDNTATISWQFPSTGFVLESTTILRATNWQPAVELPTTNNGRFEVTVPLNQQERYFRLHKP